MGAEFPADSTRNPDGSPTDPHGRAPAHRVGSGRVGSSPYVPPLGPFQRPSVTGTSSSTRGQLEIPTRGVVLVNGYPHPAQRVHDYVEALEAQYAAEKAERLARIEADYARDTVGIYREWLGFGVGLREVA